MPSDTEENRRAERQFKAREQQKTDVPIACDGHHAWEDYYAAQQKLRDRTRELREQRLALAKTITKAHQ
jgi:hypothetical protein